MDRAGSPDPSVRSPLACMLRQSQNQKRVEIQGWERRQLMEITDNIVEAFFSVKGVGNKREA